MLQTNNIYLGDCYELIKQIPDKSIDLIYTDVPYKMSYDAKGVFASKVKCQKFREEMNDDRIVKGIDNSIFDEMVRVLKDIYIYMVWQQSDISGVKLLCRKRFEIYHSVLV